MSRYLPPFPKMPKHPPKRHNAASLFFHPSPVQHIVNRLSRIPLGLDEETPIPRCNDAGCVLLGEARVHDGRLVAQLGADVRGDAVDGANDDEAGEDGFWEAAVVGMLGCRTRKGLGGWQDIRDGRGWCWLRLHFGMWWRCFVVVDNRGCFCGGGDEDSSQDSDEVGERWMRMVMMIQGKDGLSNEGDIAVNKDDHCVEGIAVADSDQPRSKTRCFEVF